MTIALLLLSVLVAFVGFDMLYLHSRHRWPPTQEDQERYGHLGRNLSPEQRARLELALGVGPLNLRSLVAIVLAAAGSVGVCFSLYLLWIDA